jgi:hypothetical protein
MNNLRETTTNSKFLPTNQGATMSQTITLPALQEGERYAGLILDEDGAPTHHLILLPGDESLTFDAATEWAASIGGVLPSRNEQALLYANCKDQFQRDWYWSGEQHAADSYSAWGQVFGSGGQSSYGKCYEGHARAVRRLTLQ